MKIFDYFVFDVDGSECPLGYVEAKYLKDAVANVMAAGDNETNLVACLDHDTCGAKFYKKAFLQGGKLLVLELRLRRQHDPSLD